MDGAKRSEFNLSEHGHVAYQIKVATILPATRQLLSDARDQTVKLQLFQDMVMLHNKLKGMEHRAPCKFFFSLYTHPHSVGWIKSYEKSKCGQESIQSSITPNPVYQ